VNPRIAYGGAAVLLVVALLGMRCASSQVAHYQVWLDGELPAVVYEPDGARSPDTPRLPVLVLSHGVGGNSSVMSSLARRLASRGIVVVTFDARGHGGNRRPFRPAMGFVPEGLIDDFDVAVLWARAQPHYDGQRLAIGGHATGASAALAYASRRDPGVAAVIAISGSAALDGPYTPPNVLLIWAERDSARARAMFRERAAELISAERLVVERVYGSFERGTAVRAAEVEWVNHLSILFSRAAADEVSTWLASALEPVPEATGRPPGDSRFLWSALGLLAMLVLLWGAPVLVAPLTGRVSLPEVMHPWSRLGLVAGALLGSILVLVGVDSVSGGGPVSAYPIFGARELLGLFGIAGAGLLIYAARFAGVRAQGLRDWRSWTGAGILFAFVYLTWGGLAQPAWDPLVTSQRLIPWAVAAALLLPWFGATEWLLRGSGRTHMWLPIAGRLVTLVALAGGTIAGLLPYVVLPGLLAIAFLFAVFEALALRLSLLMPNPWIPAIVQALWTSWLVVAFFPLEG
jgi:dienelactone hydrolase